MTAEQPRDTLLPRLALARGPLHSDALRSDPDWLITATAAGGLAVGVAGDRVAVRAAADGRPTLDWRPLGPAEAGTGVLLDPGASGASSASSTQQRPRVALLDDPPAHSSSAMQSLRDVGAELGADDASWATTAVALAQWHARHRHCPRCGTRTRVSDAGWSRTCPQDTSTHFPRTDPAVIVLVRDSRDRALLGRRTDWPLTWYSTLAGFVEAGESVEYAVRREVAEESGVHVDPARLAYRGSQPWPFPNSLMLGFHAWISGSQTPTPDGEEIAEARWFSRAEIADLAARGEVRVPPRVSIARHLIEDWYGGELDASWARPTVARADDS